MIKFNNVSKKFNSDLFAKEFVAVDSLSFEINEGKIIGFLGANGAGKTTSMKMLMDFIRPTSGEIIYSEALGQNKLEILQKIGFLPERPYFYANLTGKEFCFYMGSLSNLKKSTIVSQINKWAPIFKIDFALDREIKTYSKGMLQRIGFLVTLLHDPKLIILDEPLSGLDPIGRKELKEVIVKVNNEGKTVFFSSHIISDVEEVCQDLIFIKEGKLFYEGSVDKIISENSTSLLNVKLKKDNELIEKTIKIENQKDELTKLLSEGYTLIEAVKDKPTLEEIIYDAKS